MLWFDSPRRLSLALLVVSVCLLASSGHAQSAFDAIPPGVIKSGVNYTWSDWSGPTCPTRFYNIAPTANLTYKYFDEALQLVDKLASTFVKNWHSQLNATLGLSMSIVLGDQVVLAKGYGNVNRRPSSPQPDENSVMRLGSISKIFTSFMLMQALDRGIVSLEDPVTKFYNQANPPVFGPHNPYSSDLSGVTLHSLAQHSSGLSREVPQPTVNMSDAEVFKWVNKSPLLYAPYSTSRYSNLGTSILGQSIARAAKTSFEQWLQTQLFDVVGMSSSTFSFPPDIVKRMPIGYTLVNGIQVPVLSYAKPLYYGAPMGGMGSSAADVAQFMKAVFAAQRNANDSSCLGPNGRSSKQCIVSRSRAIEWMQGGALQRNGISGYGLGTFEQAYSNGFWIQTKAGLWGGFGSSIAMVPELQLGIFVATNMMSSTVGQVSAQGLDMLIPALIRDLDMARAPFALPANYTRWFGVYGSSNVFSITAPESGSQVPPGMLSGTFPAANMNQIVLYWDVAQDTPGTLTEPAKTAFRYNTVLAPLYSCFGVTSIGTNGVAYLYEVDGVQLVDLPDMMMFMVPKKTSE